MASNEQEIQRFPSSQEIGNKLYGMDELSQSYSRSHTSIPNDEESQPVAGRYGDSENSDDLENEKASSMNANEGNNGKPTQGGTDSTKNGPNGPAQNGHKQKVGFFHPSVKHLRLKIWYSFIKTWFVLGCLIIAMFSLYWGALYDRQGHLKGLTSLVIIEDAEVDGIPDYFGQEIYNLLQSSKFEPLATWEIYQGAEVYNKFDKGSNISADIIKSVHHRKYWSAIHVHANATYNQYLSYKNGEAVDTSIPAIEVVYESGRDITNMKPYVVTPLTNLETAFQQSFANISKNLINELSSNEKEQLIETPELISTLPRFVQLDYRPYTDNTLLAPLQVGLIYLIIISFFLFNFFAETHKLLIPHVKLPQYLLYRYLGNHISYLILALFISAVSAIFQIDFTKAYGRAGFVVYWFSNYLTLAAVGGANENMAMLIFTYNPPYVSFWLISWVILNVSPSFSPMALTNHFYRYGYMMPIHASAEIFKVLFLDLWKGQLGLYYGILVIWIVLNTLLGPLILKHVGGVMAKRAQAAAKAAAAGNAK